MKNKNLLLLLLLLLLGGATAWFYHKNKNTSLSGYDFELAVKDTANVYKIFLADADGNTVTLTRLNKKEWLLNNKYPTRPDAIQNLLATIANVELQYRLPRQAVKTAIENLASNKIKVEIYDKNNKRLKAYYVGGVTPDERGTYMILEGANEPYVMHIAGFIGALRVRYFTDSIEWRDRVIFRLTPEDIQSVSVEYPNQKAKSFKILKKSNDFDVEPFYTIAVKNPNPPVKGLVEAYLTGFKSVAMEGFENGHPQLDSIKNTVPFCIINVADMKGNSKTLKLHPILSINQYGILGKTDKGEVIIEKYYAEADNGDLYLVQHLLFDKLFWAYQGFFGGK
jgi:hypothetical protein